jgi:hypothetical protein
MTDDATVSTAPMDVAPELFLANADQPDPAEVDDA